MMSRKVNRTKDTFTYDDLDRLTGVSRNGRQTMSISYADNGNITEKTGIGAYEYNSADKPHAVREVENSDGFISSRYVYTSYDLNGKISMLSTENGSYWQVFDYGPDDEKWGCVIIDPDDKEIKYWDIEQTYWGNYEKIVKDNHVREYYYLDNDVLIIRENPNEEFPEMFFTDCYQMVRDNIGNIIAIYSEYGDKVFEAEYDAWGRQTVKINDICFNHGFTGHEMLPHFGLIHMDGRVYDPEIGRFLSPDNYVPTENSQGFNRYSYCLNNPLKYVDPDGEFPWVIIAVAGVINVAANWDGGSGFWYHAGSFVVGASAAAVATCTVGLAIAGSGALLGAGNYANAQWANGGGITIDGLVKSAGFGAATAYLGSQIGSIIKPLTDKIGNSISDRIVSRAVSNALGGATVGTAMGALFSVNDPETSWLQGAWRGLRDGAIYGAITGAAQGYYEFQQESAAARLQNVIETQQGVVKQEPLQRHHFATDKNKEFTPQMEEIVKKYGLKLSDDWNTEVLPHQGRHPNAYHRWVLKQMRVIDAMPGMNRDLFVSKFRQFVIEPVIDNPQMLYKDYWMSVGVYK